MTHCVHEQLTAAWRKHTCATAVPLCARYLLLLLAPALQCPGSVLQARCQGVWALCSVWHLQHKQLRRRRCVLETRQAKAVQCRSAAAVHT